MAMDNDQLKKVRAECRLSFLKEYDKVVNSDPFKKVEKLRNEWQTSEDALKAAYDANQKATKTYFNFLRKMDDGYDKFYKAVEDLEAKNVSEQILKNSIYLNP